MAARMRMRTVARLVGNDRCSIIKETHLESTVVPGRSSQRLMLAKNGSLSVNGERMFLGPMSQKSITTRVLKKLQRPAHTRYKGRALLKILRT